MKFRKELVPVLFLATGAALAVCGLAIMVAYGARAPIAALALLLAGLLDGFTGLIWTIVVLFSRRDETPGGPGGEGALRSRPPGPDRRMRPPAPGPEQQARAEEARRAVVLASGLLAVIFLGAVLAILLYLHVVVGCLRSWGLL